MSVVEASLPSVLRDRAHLQPTDPAFTFIDYQDDPEGRAESLTWSQIYRRARNVAREVKLGGSPGDRAVILAPQGLDYVAAFLGALEAGRVAVPLSVPFGAGDEHIHAVLRDAQPSIVLTTSSVIDIVSQYTPSDRGASDPSVLDIDSLDLDSPRGLDAPPEPTTAYLQYTSGSTRRPTGVMVSQRNLLTNFGQVMSAYFSDYGKVAPPNTTVVSWVPLSHNMGLFIGLCAPILAGLSTVFTSPMSFIQQPSRWMRLMANNSRSFSPAPNFALELAVQMTSDEDMAGCDLGDVMAIILGGERIQPATLQRFTQRFARFGLRDSVMRPSYGLAEATVYVATRASGHPPEIIHFDPEKQSSGQAERCTDGAGTALLSYGVPQSPDVKIVDPETATESPAGTIGEIWVHGDNVAMGYWGKPQESGESFGGRLVGASSDTPEGPWLKTGDLGVISEGELFIMGRIKDLLIVYGRNHYPDDIEATIQEITGGRAAAIAVPDDRTEKLVAIVEVESTDTLAAVKNEVTAALSTSHGLSIADLVMVAPGSIPTTTSGKVKRASCVEQYVNRSFKRLDG
jgi:fatty acid CoA ligase FadD28